MSLETKNCKAPILFFDLFHLLKDLLTQRTLLDRQSNPQGLGDTDKNGSDIVQQLLLEWTPLNDKESVETEVKAGPVDDNAEPGLDNTQEIPSAERSPKSKVESRQATMDDVVDEAYQKEQPKESSYTKETISEDGNLIFLERGRQKSPRPILKPRAQSESDPSWLDPSWAQQVVDTTSDAKVSQGVEDPNGRRQTEFDSQDLKRRLDDDLERENIFIKRREQESGVYLDRPRVTYNKSALDREEARMLDDRRRREAEEIQRKDEEMLRMRREAGEYMHRRPNGGYDGYGGEPWEAVGERPAVGRSPFRPFVERRVTAGPPVLEDQYNPWAQEESMRQARTADLEPPRIWYPPPPRDYGW